MLASPDGSYAVGTPSAQTLTVLEDDANQMPLNGWSLIDLGNMGGLAIYGSGINTIPDGAGGWRGQAVGFVSAAPPNLNFLGFKWDNGSSSYLYPPVGFSSPSCQGNSVNDTCTVIGQSGQFSGGSLYYPCYWRVNQINATTLSVLHSYASSGNTATDINQRNDLDGTGGVIAGNNGTSNGILWRTFRQHEYGTVNR